MVVPVRGRRALLDRFIASFDATRHLDTRLLLVADADDDSYEGMTFPAYTRMRVIPRTYVVAKVNRFAVPAARNSLAVGNTGDDNVFTTPGWDKLLMEPLATRHGWAYPDDLRRRDIPENVVISSPIIRALGWMQCPAMRHYYVDNVWGDMARACGRLFFCPWVVQPHLHYEVDPAQARDPVYAGAERHGERDKAAYEKWRRERMAADVATVRGVL